MRLGSLFDGSGGFPLAAELSGIEPTWEVNGYNVDIDEAIAWMPLPMRWKGADDERREA